VCCSSTAVVRCLLISCVCLLLCCCAMQGVPAVTSGGLSLQVAGADTGTWAVAQFGRLDQRSCLLVVSWAGCCFCPQYPGMLQVCACTSSHVTIMIRCCCVQRDVWRSRGGWSWRLHLGIKAASMSCCHPSVSSWVLSIGHAADVRRACRVFLSAVPVWIPCDA
jgi:hypothetical protein